MIRKTAEMVFVTAMFPVLWVVTRTDLFRDPDDGPLQLRELWDYHKRFWHGEE